MKKEEKRKVGRPKLADSKLKKESLLVSIGMLVSVTIATLLGIGVLRVEFDPKYTVGTIYNTHVNSCVIENHKISCGPAVIYMKYKVDNGAYTELRKQDKSIKVNLKKFTNIKYCYKTNRSKMVCK